MKEKKRINSRRKGYRVEHLLVEKLRNYGLEAKRVPLSGACEGFAGDVLLGDFKIQVKCRGSGFKFLYKAIEGFDMLAIKSDRQDFLIVIPLDLFVRFFSSYMKRKE